MLARSRVNEGLPRTKGGSRSLQEGNGGCSSVQRDRRQTSTVLRYLKIDSNRKRTCVCVFLTLNSSSYPSASSTTSVRADSSIVLVERNKLCGHKTMTQRYCIVMQ